MVLIYQPSKRIFCGWFEPLKSTTYSEYPEKEGDIEVAYTYNDGGYPMMGEEYAGGVEVRLTPYGKAVVIW